MEPHRHSPTDGRMVARELIADHKGNAKPDRMLAEIAGFFVALPQHVRRNTEETLNRFLGMIPLGANTPIHAVMGAIIGNMSRADGRVTANLAAVRLQATPNAEVGLRPLLEKHAPACR